MARARRYSTASLVCRLGRCKVRFAPPRPAAPKTLCRGTSLAANRLPGRECSTRCHRRLRPRYASGWRRTKPRTCRDAADRLLPLPSKTPCVLGLKEAGFSQKHHLRIGQVVAGFTRIFAKRRKRRRRQSHAKSEARRAVASGMRKPWRCLQSGEVQQLPFREATERSSACAPITTKVAPNRVFARVTKRRIADVVRQTRGTDHVGTVLRPRPARIFTVAAAISDRRQNRASARSPRLHLEWVSRE